MQPKRVVSLLPSATEIVALLGCEDWLMGVSHECDFPASIRTVPVLTSSRLMDQGSSKAIDLGVRGLVSEVLSIYRVDAMGLEQVRPDIVITQDLCEVCAVSLDDVQLALAQIARRDDIEILTVSPTRLTDVIEDVRRVARCLGVEETGDLQASKLSERMDAIQGRADQATSRPRVYLADGNAYFNRSGPRLVESLEILAACVHPALFPDFARRHEAGFVKLSG